MKVIFDIETDGLLESVSRIHSLCAYDLTNKKFMSCCDVLGYDYNIQYGIDYLKDSTQLIGHNIHGFDLPAIEKINGTHFIHWNQGQGLNRGVLDTQVLARLCFPDIKDKDFEGQFGSFDKKLYGKQSLEAWGGRLGVKKGNFGKMTDWKVWSKAMQQYCEQDVRVTYKLYHYLIGYIQSNLVNDSCVELEHQFARYIAIQNDNGCPFDVDKAEKLKSKVEGSLEQLKKEIDELVPEQVEEIKFTPKTSNKKYGYVKGQEVTKRKVKKVKPSSRKQILDYLHKEYGYVPDETTEKGNPKLDTDTLRSINEPECKLYADYLDLWKLRGQLWSGKNAWLKLQRNGTLYGFCNHNGAVTGRCTHSYPNLSQVPTTRKIFGRECRDLFYAPDGYKFVGADASGLELRMLGHFLEPLDGGEFLYEVINGDIHSKNQSDAGLETRDQAKTFIYAFNYGAGYEKLGSISAPGESREEKTRIGKNLKELFLEKNPAIGKLISRAQGAAKTRGYLIGLDGRKISVRFPYRALNTLLQGAGAVVMKQATVNFMACIKDYNLIRPTLHSHDEIQVISKAQYAEETGHSMVKGIIDAGKMLGIRTPLDGEFKVGKTWADTH